MPFRSAPRDSTAASSDGDRGSSSRVRRFSLLIAAAGIVLTTVLAWWTSARAEEHAADVLASRGERLAESVDDALAEVGERLAAVAGLVEASEDVTEDEFAYFIDNLATIPGMRGIGYQPILTGSELEEYQTEMAETRPGFEVFELDDEGNRIPVEPGNFHAPVQWFEPRDDQGHPHGFDSASNPDRRAALIRARWSKEMAVTSFVTLLAEDDPDGFLVYLPVIDPITNETSGFALAPMDLSELLDSQIPARLATEIEWEIEAVNDNTEPLAPENGRWSTDVGAGANSWRLIVTNAEDADASLDRLGLSPLLVAIIGLITSLLAAGVFYEYRRKIHAEQELERLRELTNAKDQFLASVSHELRTPLTGVLGFAELLRNGPDDLTDADRREMIASVAGEASDLAAIIEDLLVAARSKLDLLEITRVPVSLRANLAQVLETLDESIRHSTTLVAEENAVAMGDPGRVRQIIRNLITNAHRYGGEQIEVRISVDREVAHLEVADNGPGLPPGEVERVFEPYYRVDPDGGGNQPTALGIGLSVARHLASLMDGELAYRQENEWSVFRLSLPLAPAGVAHPEREASVAIIL